MEKMGMVVLALTFALALPVMGQEEQGLGLSPDEEQAAENLAQQYGFSWEEVKNQAGPQFQAELEALNLEDIKQLASKFGKTGADADANAGDASWKDWASDVLRGINLIDSEFGDYEPGAPGEAPSSAPAAGSETTSEAQTAA